MAYIKNKDVNRCPSIQYTSTHALAYNAFGINRYTIALRSLTWINQPAGTIMFGDAAQIAAPAASDEFKPETWREANFVDHDMYFPQNAPDQRASCAPPNWWCNKDSTYYLRRPVARHQGGTNFAFVDGHAKWYKLDRVIKTSAGQPMPWGHEECLNDNL